MIQSEMPRKGLTLIEVLVAIFVMGIGMLALLTLFPLGAMRMEQAIRHERSAQASVNARGFAKALDLRRDANVLPAFRNANPASLPDAKPTGPSYAVFVDPGPRLNGGLTSLSTFIARVSPSGVASTVSAQYMHFFNLLDDINFLRGTAAPKPIGTNYDRELVYSWAYLLQRPVLQEDRAVNLTICVFYRRPVAGTFERVLPAAGEQVLVDKLTSSIIVQHAANQPPNIQPGNWVLDASLVKFDPLGSPYNPGDAVQMARLEKVPLANFYRVTGIREVPNPMGGGMLPNTLRLDLQTPIQGYENPNIAKTFPAASFPMGYPFGEIVVMDSLAEVFEIGPGR